MAMFGTSGRETYDALYSTLQQPADTTALEREQAPGALQGDMAGALGTGIYRGLSRGAALSADAFTPTLRPFAKTIDELFGSSTDAWLLGEQDKTRRALVESKLDPKTNGTAAQVLYGLGDVLTTVASTRGVGPAAGIVYGYGQNQIGLAEGLDPMTAGLKAAIEGGAMGLSVALPAALTGKLAFRMLSGAGLNVGVGIPERMAVSTLLNARGYSEMARQYAPLDATSIMTELVLGAAFGGLLGPRARAAKLPPPEAVPPSAVDAALTANQSLHAEIGTAPGVPTNTRTREAHAAALNTAVESMVMGRDVSVENLLTEAGFLGKRPDFDALRVIADELDKAGAADLVAQVRALEADAKSRGLVVEPDSLGSVVLSDKPVETTVTGPVVRESSVRIGEDKVPTRLMLVEAGDVQATMMKADNQFRDRTRVASEQQIADIASRLDAALLMDAPVMDYGAPVLAADGTVIGGNGRAAAVGRAYEQGSADAYRAALREQFGEAVDNMQAPMLVRVLQKDVDIQKAAILSNEGGGLRMSALEQAKVDAERLGDLRGVEFTDDGMADMTTIRQWVGEMPQNQRAAIMDADGRLSAEGAKRLQNAVLFKAYGDSPTLARLVESTDPGSRNIAAALTRAAPAVADARAAIERGDLYPIGLHDDLIAAVERLDGLRRDGLAVGDWVRQIDAFGDGMTPEARLLVQFLDSNIRASRVMSDGIFGFYNRLLELGNPKQGSMFEAAQPDKMRMLTLALDGDAPMYGRGSGARSLVADLTSAFRAMFGRDADRLLETGRVRIVQSVSDLPGSGHPADVGGMFWRGEAWVVADNTGLSQIRGRALHEIGEHAGMQQMLGDALYQQVLDTVARKSETDPVFQEARALAEARANRPEHVPAETLAYLVENAPELPVVRRMLAAVRQWLYRVTGGRFVDLTQADLQMMAVASLRRYAREAEVAAKGDDAPWYMTLFHGSPTAFKPEEGAPLGRLRWKFINTGEGAQAYGYGHYLAQQEWIARTRYRDRLVGRKAKQAQLEIPHPNDPDAKFVIDDSTGPGYRIGDRIVHANMGGEEGGIGWAIRELKNTNGDVEQVRAWAQADIADDRVKLEAYQRANMNEGSLNRIRDSIAQSEAALQALDELTVAGPVQWLVKFQEDYNGKMAEQVSEFNTRAEAENYLARVLLGNGRVEEVMGRVIRPDITEVRPEPPKGALYGKFIPDETWQQMMIWDAPLSAQPDVVRAAFEKLEIREERAPEWALRDDGYLELESGRNTFLIKELKAPDSLETMAGDLGIEVREAPVDQRPDWAGGSPWEITWKDGSVAFYDDAEAVLSKEWLLDKYGIDSPTFEVYRNGQSVTRDTNLDEAKRYVLDYMGVQNLTGENAYNRLVGLLRDYDRPDVLDDLEMTAASEIATRRAPEGVDPAEFDVDLNIEERASVILSLLGIPGHRFLDGETRAMGWDSPEARFNVVLYSDDLGRVAWEANGKAGEEATEWTTANGRGRIEFGLPEDAESPFDTAFVVTVDGETVGKAATIEEATRMAEGALDGQLYSRGDTMQADPIEDTTMPDARAFSAQVDAEIASAQELSQGFLPAVECALRVGA